MAPPEDKVNELALLLERELSRSVAGSGRIPHLQLVEPGPPGAQSAPKAGEGHRARLRQRLLDGGPDALLDHELVEYLLALAIPRRDTKAQAKALIARYGGLGPLLEAEPAVLRKEGLTEGMIGALMIARATALRLLETRVEQRPSGNEARQSAFPMQRRIGADTERSPSGEVLTLV